MKSIAFHIQKGGVGKTTISGNIAFNLARNNKKTLLVDCDPQGNSSSWFLGKTPINSELSDVLKGSIYVDESIIKFTDFFHLLPTSGLSSELKPFTSSALINKPFLFCDLKEEIKNLGYDFVIYDMSPGMSILERSVLLASDEVIVPLTPEYFSIDGIEIFNNELHNIIKDFRVSIKFDKIVVNNYNKSFREHNEYYKSIKILNYNLFTIGQETKLSQCVTLNKSIFDYYPKSRVIPELDNLTSVLIAEGV